MSHRRAFAASAAASLLLFGACAPGAPTDAPQSAEASPSASHSPTPPASASATPEATPSMGEPGLDATKPINADNWMSSVEGLPPVRSDDPAKALALTGIRAARHEGFTRVVLEFAGKGTPGVWSAAWTDEAVEQGRGLPIQVAGARVRAARVGFLGRRHRRAVDDQIQETLPGRHAHARRRPGRRLGRHLRGQHARCHWGAGHAPIPDRVLVRPGAHGHRYPRLALLAGLLRLLGLLRELFFPPGSGLRGGVPHLLGDGKPAQLAHARAHGVADALGRLIDGLVIL